MNRESKITERIVAAYGMPTMERRHYIPAGVETELIEPPNTDIEVRVYESNGKIYGIAWAGTGNKPVWHYRFPSRERLDQAVAKLIFDRKSRKEMMDKRMQERREYKHDLKVGDILYSSWGYDQTNISWYQVTAVGEKSVKIREIDGKIVAGGSEGSESVVASPGHFTGPDMVKIVRPGNSVRLTSYSSAYPWDGKPKYQTALGWGH